MYNDTYHPLQGLGLEFILDNTTEEERQIIMDRVNTATVAKERNYEIILKPPRPDGTGGTWYRIQNGIVVGSCREE